MTIGDVEDRVRKYTAIEDEHLARQLRAIAEDVHSNRLWPISIVRLREIHARLFDGVRDHAGRFRARAYGDEHLTFGPNRSVNRDDVADELEVVVRRLEVSIRSFEDNPDDADYERSALHLALWAHAEIIRIHPFMDGNGRSSRTVMNVILVGLGLQPLAIEVPKQEYNEALNHYFREKDIQVLLDLALGLVDP